MPVITDVVGDAEGGGKWVVPLSNGNVLQSADGITFNNLAAGLGATLAAIAFGGGTFCGNTSQGAGTSPDGVTWTAQGVAGVATFLSNGPMYWDGAQFINISIPTSDSGFWHIYTSPTGVAWADVGRITGGAIGGGDTPISLILAFGDYFLSSSGGTLRKAATLAALLAAADTVLVGFAANIYLAFGAGLLVAVGHGDGVHVPPAASTTDGNTWTAEASQFPAGDDTTGICYYAASNIFVAVGSVGTISTRVG